MRRVLKFNGKPVVLDEIYLPGEIFQGLSLEVLQEYQGSLYSLFETRFGVRMIRADKRNALDGDPQSAFGGVLGMNQPVDAETAEVLATPGLFVEAIVAPNFSPEAVKILSADIVYDMGVSMNPAIDIGQVEGAFIQGMGWLTTEELWWDEKGRLRTHAPSTYKIPGSRDVPPVFNTRLIADQPNREQTIYRSKAIGEPPLMLGIAVWTAIFDAIASLNPGQIPSLDAPATPEAILRAVRRMGA